MLRFYPAIVHKDPDSDFGVSFPDFPGCVTAGLTQTEALVFAKEALALHVEGIIADGDELPHPTSLEHLESDIAEDGQVAVSLIEVVLPGRSKRINITIEESLLNEIDSAIGILGTNRSAFLGEAARHKLGEVFTWRLEKATAQTGSVIGAVDRIIREDNKAKIREDHPPEIGKIGRSGYE
ncbi:MAG: type II toxin-antitoxin system HicB family antitoxin [Magnetovibrio sp.]|nr:type II toxin-antitoxin system HicB family antitoxin [Magnetovibrio sp.]